jgi:sterol desaturase/sphingolipid hydroxylase (fatty acid hydroxylase superfamily)
MALNTLLEVVSPFLSQFPLLRTLAHAVVLFTGIFLVVFCLELLAGSNLRRYLSREFVTDLIYAMVYQGGIYNTLLYAPIFAGVALVMPSWNLEVLARLPPLIGFLIFWVVSDAIGYWIHRWQHSNAVLWCFHSVHHAQTCLTFVTSYRNHLLEQLFSNFLMYVPLMLLGMPKWYWVPAVLLQHVFEALQHSDLKWRFGRLYPILVSPVFHAIHHSPDRARHDSNYGKVLSVWDYLFDTMSRGDRPAKYGVAGLDMPISFWGTLIAPFRQLRTRATARPPVEARYQR